MPRLPDTPYFVVPPDWVCELSSPSTASFDRVKKLPVHAREHVAHAWLIDPTARTLEVLRLQGGRWVIMATHAGNEVVRAEPFAEIEIDLQTLWEEPTEGP
jgi:Uma2 family endonuclease